MSSVRDLFQLSALPRSALALAALGVTGLAAAQSGNPVAGETLYKAAIQPSGTRLESCESCHGVAGVLYDTYRAFGRTEAEVVTIITNAIASRGVMAAYRTAWGPQQRADVAAYIMRGPHATRPPSPPSPPLTPAPPPPALLPTPSASPVLLLFNNTQLGQLSPVVGTQITNNATVSITLGANPVTIVTGSLLDFQSMPPAGTACSANLVLAPGMTCQLAFRFTPTGTLTGPRQSTWNVNFAGGVSSRTLTLQGSATALPAPTPAPGPAPTPTPTPSPAPVPAASGSASEGGGASGPMTLTGLLLIACAAARRRRPG